MSATPTPIVQQPPGVEVTQQAYTTHSGHGSVGPVIGVLAVIAVLGVAAGMIGRLCSGRRVMGHGEYDFESWVETKCSSCVDGTIAPPRPPAPQPQQHPDTAQPTSGEDPPSTAAAQEVSPEIKEEDDEDGEEEEEEEEPRKSSISNGNKSL